MKKKRKKINPILLIVIVLLVIAFIGTLIKVIWDSRNDAKSGDGGEKTAVEQILSKNLDKEKDYPSTPREVVKLYCQITKELYSGECSEGNTKKLFVQMRKLFDSELLSYNEEEVNYNNLLGDIEGYKKDKKQVVSYFLPPVEDISIHVYDEVENALVNITFSIKEGTEWQRVHEQFALRRDEDGHWKILGWQALDTAVNESNDENNDEK